MQTECSAGLSDRPVPRCPCAAEAQRPSRSRPTCSQVWPGRKGAVKARGGPAVAPAVPQARSPCPDHGDPDPRGLGPQGLIVMSGLRVPERRVLRLVLPVAPALPDRQGTGRAAARTPGAERLPSRLSGGSCDAQGGSQTLGPTSIRSTCRAPSPSFHVLTWRARGAGACAGGQRSTGSGVNCPGADLPVPLLTARVLWGSQFLPPAQG